MEEKTCGGESRGMQTGVRQLLRWFGIALIVISMLGPAFAPVSYGAEDSQVKTVKITTKPASGQINRAEKCLFSFQEGGPTSEQQEDYHGTHDIHHYQELFQKAAVVLH